MEAAANPLNNETNTVHYVTPTFQIICQSLSPIGHPIVAKALICVFLLIGETPTDVDMSSLLKPPDCPGLDILASVARLFKPDAALPSVDSWIQCDACFRWRRSNGEVFSNGRCIRWFCEDAGRNCADPCDYCKVPDCNCAPSQSYCGYSTTGYSLPEGFSVVIRFRHGEDIEVGKPWLTYRSWCQSCGQKSKGIDRRAHMMQWLSKHRHHNSAWEQLTVDAFDFKVDEKIRDMYMCYVRLHRKGLIGPGLRDAVNEAKFTIAEDQRNELQSLLEIVEASRFYDERAIVVGRDYSRKRMASRTKHTEEQTPTPIRKRRRKRIPRQQDDVVQHPLVRPKKPNSDPESSSAPIKQENGVRPALPDMPLDPMSQDAEPAVDRLMPNLIDSPNRSCSLPVPRILPPPETDPMSNTVHPINPILRSQTCPSLSGDNWNQMPTFDQRPSVLDASLAGYPPPPDQLLTSFQRRILFHPPPCGHSFANCFYRRS